ncbi:hypothetical protein NXW23_11670 [Bacteroides caccae]|uniref:Uncharacterized protein n=1 Tax=Bacteroides caccae TaxID=47678 RepID=A0AA94Y6X6_9BACE|nr:hypothetical protein NXW23_11670 [Bacteroides caccae]DAO28294.1 MAG TPA: hypothetical protein [Caudoviricetes sp.]DAU54864.1 MAG TPA: hypothetical protein [Caudoviricetes sp.]
MENELILPPQEESRLAALKTSPERYCKMLRPKTIEDVFLSSEPAIGTITRILGETKSRAAVVLLLADALEFFNATETMSDVQVAITVDLIMEEYPYFKMDDLKLCFKNAMKMKYGRIYNRIDGQVIMSWLREYNKERCTAADTQSWNEHKSHIEDELKSMSGMFYEEYRTELEKRASSGDESAINALRISNSLMDELVKRRFKKQKMQLKEFYNKQES